MATAAPSFERTQFFQQLKRVCVPLTELALRPKGKDVDTRDVLRLLEELIGLWTIQANKDSNILDDRLADYVFFPLSQLLRNRERYAMRVTEAIIRLFQGLIQYGWKAKVSPQLFQQLLIFLSLVIGGVPGQQKQDTPEETIIEAFRTLVALFAVAEPSHLAAPAEPASEGETPPPVSQSVSVMLDAITEGVASQIQVEAAQCLRTVFARIKDSSVLARFLPGTVSALSTVLSPPQANRTQKRVLLQCLEVLNLVLVSVLGDIKVRALLKQLESSRETAGHAGNGQERIGPRNELTPAWLKATAAQIKILLSQVLKLRAHESEDIQSALHRFCISLLDECHSSLAECRSILVESAMMLEDEDAMRPRLETSLQDLAGVYPELGDCMKAALYNWVTGLPRVMQSNDERARQLAIRSILRGSKQAAALHMDSSTLDDALADSLRDSVIALVKGSKQSRIVDDTGADISSSTELVRSGSDTSTYHPVLLESESQKATRKEISSLISSIGSAVRQVKLGMSMLSHVRDSEGVDQIVSFWLAFEFLKATYAQSSDIEGLLDLSSLGESRHQEEAFRELYDFSASVLSAHSDSVEVDWRLEALALEVTAFAAARSKLDFRPELIDVLYPVTTFLGSQAPQMRRHAITTLNVVAASCGYESVSDLIVDNADYMVNSISLRLNTFDISPASTKVLTMLIRLTGPRLIPFLDDVVAAIFAALDNYHGYPVFVESLFSVLSEVVAQGVKSDMLLLEDASSKTIDHKKKRPETPGIAGTLKTLDERLERAARSDEDHNDLPSETHPKQPWGPEKSQAASLLDELANPTPDSDTDPDADPASEEQAPDNKKKALEERKQTPTYALLTRVLSLTQHYLTSPTPTLRKSLLDLISTVSPALAPDENAFLPLVHTVWSVVLARMHDPEPYVSIAACRALAGLCKGAGDFLGSRFKSEWWGGSGSLGKWVRKVKEDALTKGGRKKVYVTGSSSSSKDEILIPVRERGGEGVSETRIITSSSSGGAALGRFAQAAQVWEAALGLLTAIVSYVRVEDEMFDDILSLVVDVLPQHGGLREALETVNADAVWLAMYERGMVQRRREAPVVEGFDFVFASMEVR